MAINIGAFVGPLITGRLGDRRGWHWDSSAAAIGMTFGLVQYAVGRRHLAGRKHTAEFARSPQAMRRALRLVATGLVATAAAAVLLTTAGRLTMDRFVDHILFQAYSTMMRPAPTDAETSILGYDFPVGRYASALGAFEVALAPVVAALSVRMLWVRMGHRQPHASNKIAIGVVLGGLSFLLMALPTSGSPDHSCDDHLISVWWIVGSYLLLGLGDILLETSGMSATSKLAPAAFAGQTMSLRFLSLALANGFQAQTVKLYDDVSQPACFGVNGAIAVATGLAVTAAAPWLRRTMHPVHRPDTTHHVHRQDTPHHVH
jgi:POT family proton-dependent oligopeptide transporter